MSRYRSNFEFEIAKALFKKKIKFHYEATVIHYTLSNKYYPDFIFNKKNGGTMIVEAKGYLKPSDRKKMKAIKEQYPDIDIRILFQKDNYLGKAKGKRYSDWAESLGFKYHVGDRIPDKWLKEIK